MLGTTNKYRKLADWFFASATSLGAIYAFVVYLWPLMSKRSWAIVFLSLTVIGLIVLQAIFKSNYEHLVDQANWSAKKAWFNSHKLALMLGQVTQLFECLEQGHLLSVDSLKTLDAFIRRTIQDCYFADWSERINRYYDGWEGAPDGTAQAQKEWLSNHSQRLKDLIIQEQPSILE